MAWQLTDDTFWRREPTGELFLSRGPTVLRFNRKTAELLLSALEMDLIPNRDHLRSLKDLLEEEGMLLETNSSPKKLPEDLQVAPLPSNVHAR